MAVSASTTSTRSSQLAPTSWSRVRQSSAPPTRKVQRARCERRRTGLRVASTAARRTQVRVRYADTDQMGVVYYANYLVWFEVARTEWLREGGWSYREMEADGISLPVIEAHCEYRQPARYDDEIEIRT